MEWQVPETVLKAFYRAFPDQTRWGARSASKHLAAVMQKANLTPEALVKRIAAWRRVHAVMPPWQLADLPPTEPVNTGLFAPLEDRPARIIPAADPSAREWAKVQTSIPEVEDV